MKFSPKKLISELKPLDVQCRHTICEKGFHSHTSKVTPKNGKVGDCNDCGDSSIDWERIHKNDSYDRDYTIVNLKRELIRHICWSAPMEEAVIQYAQKRGRSVILARAEVIIRRNLAKIPTGRFDFMCTPKKGKEIIHYAQHATATCCRKCLERWHGIPQDTILDESQITYCVGWLECFTDDRMPNLKEEFLQQ